MALIQMGSTEEATAALIVSVFNGLVLLCIYQCRRKQVDILRVCKDSVDMLQNLILVKSLQTF